MNNPFQYIIAPLVTEKSNAMAAEHKYAFRVKADAGKIEIARAIEEIFKVKVGSVNVMNYAGKRKRVGRGAPGRRADWKRAVVTLAEGSIEII